MKRQKYTIGSIVEIPVNNGEYYCYGQLIGHGECAVFDYRSSQPIPDLSALNNARVLFRVCLYRHVIGSGEWLKIGKLPLRKELKLFPDQYIYHDWDKKFFLYKVESGEIIPASKDLCRNLERCAVWDSKHVEDRISSHFNNVPCIWMKEDYELFSD